MAQVIKPDPDPTVLTTASLLREIEHLEKLMEEKFSTRDARMKSIEARLDHKYTETADAIRNLRELHDEKFKGLDELTKQAREDGKTRLETAFKSASDSQEKIEKSLTNQIAAIGAKSEASNTTTNEKVDRLTSRIDQGAGRDVGVDHSRQERTVDKGQTLVTISIMIALGALITTVVLAVLK